MEQQECLIFSKYVVIKEQKKTGRKSWRIKMEVQREAKSKSLRWLRGLSESGEWNLSGFVI